MLQSYVLKSKGLSLWEQAMMTAEERKWWMGKIEEEYDRIKKSTGSHQL